MTPDSSHARPRGAGIRAVGGAVSGVLRSLVKHRLGWAIPLALLLLAMAGLLALLSLVPAIAPFIYPVL